MAPNFTPLCVGSLLFLLSIVARLLVPLILTPNRLKVRFNPPLLRPYIIRWFTDTLSGLPGEMDPSQRSEPRDIRDKLLAAIKQERQRRTIPQRYEVPLPATITIHTSTIHRLPDEILEKILLELPAESIARSREICRFFRSVVDKSAILRYKVECFLAGAVDNPSARLLSSRGRLERLLKWRQAWKTLAWTEVSPVTAFDGVTLFREPEDNQWPGAGIVASGSVLCAQNVSTREIIVHRIPSIMRGISSATWTIDDVGFVPAIITHDHSQDLLVLGNAHFGGPFTLSFRSLTSGQAHPSAPIAELTIPTFKNVNKESTFKMQAAGSKVAVRHLTEEEEGTSEVWVVDWKRGITIFHTYELAPYDDIPYHFYDPHDFTLLGDTHIVISIVTDTFAGIALFDLEDVAVEEPYYISLRRAVIFCLPEIEEDSPDDYGRVDIDSNPCHPPQLPDGEVPFAWNNNRQLMKIQFYAGNPVLWVLAPAQVLFWHIGKAVEYKGDDEETKYRRVEWEIWCFDVRCLRDIISRLPTVCGSKYAYLIPTIATREDGPTGPTYNLSDVVHHEYGGQFSLIVWDFAPPQGLLRDLITNEGDVEQYEINEWDLRHIEPFYDYVWSMAPYKQISYHRVLGRKPHRLIFCDDGVVISTEGGRRYSYTI